MAKKHSGSILTTLDNMLAYDSAVSNTRAKREQVDADRLCLTADSHYQSQLTTHRTSPHLTALQVFATSTDQTHTFPQRQLTA